MIQLTLIMSIVSLAAGILVFVFPSILNYIVAIYLVVIGLVGIFSHILSSSA